MRAALVSLSGTVVIIIAGVALTVAGKPGVLLILFGATGIVVVIAMVVRGRRLARRVVVTAPRFTDKPSRRRKPESRGTPGRSETGVILRRWVGSASIPGAMGYIEVGVWLAVLEAKHQSLVLRARPRFVRIIFGLDDLAVALEDTTILPAHKLGRKGVEIRRSGQASSFFWTSKREEILNYLATAGFEVSEEEQKGP